MLIILCIIIALILLIYFLIKPSRPKQETLVPFQYRNYAHRGLHSKNKTTPENSLPAFKKAVKYGYGIELDIQFTKDFQIVVFHDDTLDRVCHVSGRVDEYTYKELLEFSLEGTNYKIPLFTDVLSVVDGQVPLIVELKTGSHNKQLCEDAYAILKNYKGHFCIESFDPTIVRWFYQNAPDILRGQLTRSPKKLHKTLNLATSILLGHALTNFLCRPNFIAYDKHASSPLVSLAYKLGAIRVVWTVRPHDNPRDYESKNDMVIFEFYNPYTIYER